jgi:hypothetical protein
MELLLEDSDKLELSLELKDSDELVELEEDSEDSDELLDSLLLEE